MSRPSRKSCHIFSKGSLPRVRKSRAILGSPAEPSVLFFCKACTYAVCQIKAACKRACISAPIDVSGYVSWCRLVHKHVHLHVPPCMSSSGLESRQMVRPYLVPYFGCRRVSNMAGIVLLAICALDDSLAADDVPEAFQAAPEVATAAAACAA